MNTEFAGKTVAVSGAAIGFGRAIGTRFAEAGAHVFGCDILDPADADAAAFAMDRVDLLDRKAGADWIKSIEQRTGRAIDILVCNAGGVAGLVNKPIEDVGDDEWDRVIGVNLGATFTLCRAAAAAMKRVRQGVIVTITSGAALQASLTGMLEPVSNPIWVFLFLGEKPSLYAIAGALVVLSAIAWHTMSGEPALDMPASE